MRSCHLIKEKDIKKKNNGPLCAFMYLERTGHIFYGTDLVDDLWTDDCSICDKLGCSYCRIQYIVLKCGSHHILFQGFDRDEAERILNEENGD